MLCKFAEYATVVLLYPCAWPDKVAWFSPFTWPGCPEKCGWGCSTGACWSQSGVWIKHWQQKRASCSFLSSHWKLHMLVGTQLSGLLGFPQKGAPRPFLAVLKIVAGSLHGSQRPSETDRPSPFRAVASCLADNTALKHRGLYLMASAPPETILTFGLSGIGIMFSCMCRSTSLCVQKAERDLRPPALLLWDRISRGIGSSSCGWLGSAMLGFWAGMALTDFLHGCCLIQTGPHTCTVSTLLSVLSPWPQEWCISCLRTLEWQGAGTQLREFYGTALPLKRLLIQYCTSWLLTFSSYGFAC